MDINDLWLDLMLCSIVFRSRKLHFVIKTKSFSVELMKANNNAKVEY